MASNLIGRLAEATNPVASIAGPKLGHAPAGVAQERALAATCPFLSPPFSLPPYLERFHRNLGAPGGFWSAGRGGERKGLGGGTGGGNRLHKACLGLGGPQAAGGTRRADHGPGVSGRGLQRALRLAPS